MVPLKCYFMSFFMLHFNLSFFKMCNFPLWLQISHFSHVYSRHHLVRIFRDSNEMRLNHTVCRSCMFAALLHEGDGRNTVCVMRREEGGGGEVQGGREESVCF